MALRRLARCAFHRASGPPPPQPLASLSPNPRVPLIHLRFCTSSPTPPHFMVDYLVSTCGLPRDRAVKVAPRFAHLSSPERPDAAIAFLRSKGLSRAQVREVVNRCPFLLLSDTNATIAPKFRAVRSAGLTHAEAARLFALCPQALTWGIDTCLLPRVVFWLDLLGSTSLLMKWLSKEWLLKYSVDLLLRNLSALRDLGIPRARLAVMLRQKPSLIMQRPEKIQALIDRVDACGVPRGSGMYLWALVVLHGVRPAAFQTKKAAMMAAIGCTEQEFLAMFRRAPCFLYVSTELLLRKVEFLKDTLGCHRDYIVRNPVLLTFSLTKRMAPRCRTIEALRSRGVDIGKGSPVNAVRLSEAKFMERYILKYIEEAPELLGLYSPKS